MGINIERLQNLEISVLSCFQNRVYEDPANNLYLCKIFDDESQYIEIRAMKSGQIIIGEREIRRIKASIDKNESEVNFWSQMTYFDRHRKSIDVTFNLALSGPDSYQVEAVVWSQYDPNERLFILEPFEEKFVRVRQEKKDVPVKSNINRMLFRDLNISLLLADHYMDSLSDYFAKVK